MSKELEIIGEAVADQFEDERWEIDWDLPREGLKGRVAAHVVSRLSEHGYSIVPSESLEQLERAVNRANAHRFDFTQPEETLGHRKVGGPDDFYNGARYVTLAFRRTLRAIRAAAAPAEEDTNG